MKLIPFDPQYLRAGEPLPFGLRDEGGRLLLAAGESIQHAGRLQDLAGQRLFAAEHEAADWYRRLTVVTHERLMHNALLKDVAAVRPERNVRDGSAVRTLTFADEWEEIVLALDSVLRDARSGSDWVARLEAVQGRAGGLLRRRPDASLYLQVYQAGQLVEKYSSRHAVLAMTVCELAAPLLGWPPEDVRSLGLAALTMNVAMHRLQHQLAASEIAPTEAMRAQIDAHPAAGAAQLAAAGWSDTLAIEVVRRHHEGGPAGRALASMTAAERLAGLLHRIDVFTAKISRRAGRSPMSPVRAAREACLGPGGRPDEIGGVLLKAVGMYPPGSFVELASGEKGIVLARGRRANLPWVASLIGAAGHALGEPALRDTLDQRHAVKGAVPADTVRVRPPHEKLLAMR